MYTVDEIKNHIFCGHVLDELRKFPDACIDAAMTSCPYYSLRDYGTPPVIFGGDLKCEHNFEETDKSIVKNSNDLTEKKNAVCKKCGARLTNFGLEKTPSEYVTDSVEIYREVRRVLKPEGTFWLNIGDSYVGDGSGGHGLNSPKKGTTVKYAKNPPSRSIKEGGLKPKDMIGIPWSVALALRNDGWYLRSDIIWQKGNAMCSSVNDRPTSSYEHVFLFAKSERYYYDYKAIRERSETTWNNKGFNGSYSERMSKSQNRTYGAGTFHDNNDHNWRNKRDVWCVNTRPLKELHVAPWPLELITPMILAGCPKGGIVLDIFMGSGSTAVAAVKNKRNYTGIELNPEYIKIIEKRLAEVDVNKYMKGSNLEELFEY